MRVGDASGRKIRGVLGGSSGVTRATQEHSQNDAPARASSVIEVASHSLDLFWMNYLRFAFGCGRVDFGFGTMTRIEIGVEFDAVGQRQGLRVSRTTREE